MGLTTITRHGMTVGSRFGLPHDAEIELEYPTSHIAISLGAYHYNRHRMILKRK